MTDEKRSLSTQIEERGLTPAQWHTLQENLYPGANPRSVLMVIDYCIARKLDPLKKPCHIVPMKVDGAWRDVVMPGIYEYRTTAQRTGEYLGHSEPKYGATRKCYGIKAPGYCKIVVYRWNKLAQEAAEFPVTVRFDEVVGTRLDKKSGELVANSRWAKAPVQMLTKCAEAAALREAFPDELGGEMTVEEMDAQAPIIEAEAEPLTQPAGESDAEALDAVNAELGLSG